MQNLARAGVTLSANTRFCKGAGCAQCRGEGFKGRAGVDAMQLVSPAVTDAIARGAAAHDIRTLTSGEGSDVKLECYATFLLTEGLTVSLEVLRILPKIQGPLST